jgi:hypothetical protein
MATDVALDALLQAFDPRDRETLLAQAQKYDDLVARLPRVTDLGPGRARRTRGILALNGASGAGQSYVMARVKKFLDERSIELPRIYLLGTREPRPDEGHKDPYIFVREVPGGYQDIHHPGVTYAPSDIYYEYESRPGARNAILLEDARAALEGVMYLETVIPTLLHIKNHDIAGILAWEDDLQIVYLAAPTGGEWIYRLVNREPERLQEEGFRAKILGRTTSSISDMEITAEHEIPVVLNHYGKAEQAAREILTAWGL